MSPLALIEVLDRDGRSRSALAVHQWPVRIGRAIDNDIVLDDPHVAPHHALIDGDADGATRLQVLPSVNGVLVGRRYLAAGETQTLPGSELTWTAGTTRLRVRLAGAALEPERPLQRATSHRSTLLLGLLLWGWLMADRLLRLDPGAEVNEWLMPLLAFPTAIAAWCMLWALASKLFQHRFDFWPHLAVAVRLAMAIEVAEFALPMLASITGWTLLSRLTSGVAAALAVAMLLGHARLVLPHLRRALAFTSAAAFVAGAGILLTLNLQRDHRWFNELYVAVLPPPALLWATPVSQDRFLANAAAMRKALDSQVQDWAVQQKAASDADDE